MQEPSKKHAIYELQIILSRVILIRNRSGTGGKRPQAGQNLQGRRRSSAKSAGKEGVDRGDLDLAGTLRQITDATPR